MKDFGNNVMDYCCYKHSKDFAGTPEKRVKDAAHIFGITLGNAKGSYYDGKKLYDSIPLRSARTGIEKDMLFDFYKGSQSEDEIAALMAFLAVKSIIGEKPYAKITKKWLLCRMAGYNAMEDMSTLPEYLQKYNTRHHFEKLETELRKYGVKIYARYTRGLYMSLKLSLEELIRTVEIKRKKYIEKQQKDEQSAAVRKVLADLYKTAS